MSRPDNTVAVPLTSVVFEILLALADRERHGYEIMQEIESRGEKSIRLRPGTLYRAIHRLLADGFLAESDAPEGSVHDDRRRYYRLTSRGMSALRLETERMDDAVQRARAKWLASDRS